MVPVFCDQVVAMLVVKSDTGKRNLAISLDIVREKCTGRFYIVDSGGVQQMLSNMRYNFANIFRFSDFFIFIF